METGDTLEEVIRNLEEGTDPTYKEWKLIMVGGLYGQDVAARILPTRNGNLYV